MGVYTLRDRALALATAESNSTIERRSQPLSINSFVQMLRFGSESDA